MGSKLQAAKDAGAIAGFNVLRTHRVVMSWSAECILHACLPRPSGARLRKKGQDITIIILIVRLSTTM